MSRHLKQKAEANEPSPLPESQAPPMGLFAWQNPGVGFKRLRHELWQDLGSSGGQEAVIKGEKQAEFQTKYAEFGTYSR